MNYDDYSNYDLYDEECSELWQEYLGQYHTETLSRKLGEQPLAW